MTSNQATWCDLTVQNEPHPTLCYRTAMTVYEESLIRGRLVGRAWNGAGYANIWEEGTRLDPTKHPTPQAFWLEVDGQLLASHWQWVDLQKTQEAGNLHAVLTLRHSHRGYPYIAGWYSAHDALVSGYEHRHTTRCAECRLSVEWRLADNLALARPLAQF